MKHSNWFAALAVAVVVSTGCNGTRAFISLDPPKNVAQQQQVQSAQVFVAETLDPVDIDAFRGPEGDPYCYAHLPGLVGNSNAKVSLWPYENGPFAGPRAGTKSQETKGAELPDGPLSVDGGWIKVSKITVDELGFVCGSVVDPGFAYFNPLDFDNWWQGVPALSRPSWTGVGVAESPRGRHLVFYGWLKEGSYLRRYHEDICNKPPVATTAGITQPAAASVPAPALTPAERAALDASRGGLQEDSTSTMQPARRDPCNSLHQ